MATQLVKSDSGIAYIPLQKSLFRFMPAYTVLTTAAAYPSEINKKDVRNLDFNAAPKVTDHREVDIYWNDEEHWGRTLTVKTFSGVTADKKNISDILILKQQTIFEIDIFTD